MALLRYKNFLANNVVVLIVKDKDTEFLIQYCSSDGLWREQLFKKPDRIRVMINGNITNQITTGNTLVVYGDINRAKVGNSVSVEGYVTNYNCPRNSITVDRTLKVAHGNDARTNMGKQSRASVLHIDGDTCKVSFPFPKHFRVEIKGFVLEIVGTDIVFRTYIKSCVPDLFREC